MGAEGLAGGLLDQLWPVPLLSVCAVTHPFFVIIPQPLLIFLKIFLYLKVSVRVTPPRYLHWQVYEPLVSEARNFIQVSHVSGRILNTCTISHCFSRCLTKELDWSWSNWSLYWCPYGMLSYR